LPSCSGAEVLIQVLEAMSAIFKLRDSCADAAQQTPISAKRTTGALFSRITPRNPPRMILESGKGSPQFGVFGGPEPGAGESPISLTRTENGTESTQLEDAKPSVDDGEGSVCLSTPRDEVQAAAEDEIGSNPLEAANPEPGADEGSVSMTAANLFDATPLEVAKTDADEAEVSLSTPRDGTQPATENGAGELPACESPISSIMSSKEGTEAAAEDGSTPTRSGVALWNSKFGSGRTPISLPTSPGDKKGATSPVGSPSDKRGTTSPVAASRSSSIRLAFGKGDQNATPKTSSTRLPLSTGSPKAAISRTGSMRLLAENGDQKNTPKTGSMRLPLSTGEQKGSPKANSLRVPSSTGEQKDALPKTGSMRLPLSTGDQKEALPRTGSMRLHLSTGDQKDSVPKANLTRLLLSTGDQKASPGTGSMRLPQSTGEQKVTPRTGLSISSGDPKATAFGASRTSSPRSVLRPDALTPRTMAALETDCEKLESLEQMQVQMHANQMSIHSSQIHVLSRELGELQKNFLSFRREINQTVEDLWSSFQSAQDEAHAALRLEFAQSAGNADEMKAAWEEAHKALSASMEKGLSDLAEQNAKALEDHASAHLQALEEHKVTHGATMSEMADMHNKRCEEHEASLQQGLEDVHGTLQKELADLRSGHAVDLKNVVMELTKQVDKLTLDLAQVATDCSAAQEEGHAALRLELAEHGSNADEMKAAWEEAHKALSKALDDGLGQVADEHAKALGEHAAQHSDSLEQVESKMAAELARFAEENVDMHGVHNEKHAQHEAALEKVFDVVVERAQGRLQEELADKLNSMFGRMKSAIDVKFTKR